MRFYFCFKCLRDRARGVAVSAKSRCKSKSSKTGDTPLFSYFTPPIRRVTGRLMSNNTRPTLQP